MDDIGPSPAWRDGERTQPLPGPYVIRLEFEGFVRVDVYGNTDEILPELRGGLKTAMFGAIENLEWVNDIKNDPYTEFGELVDYDVEVQMG